MINTLKDFVRSQLHCSYDDAEKFISNFHHWDAVDYGRNVIENHTDDFPEDFDIDSLDEDDFADIAIALEDLCCSELSTKEDTVLRNMFVCMK